MEESIMKHKTKLCTHLARRIDLSISVHQAGCFCIDPNLFHEEAMQRVGKYLIGTAWKGIVFKPDCSKEVKVFTDAYFTGRWNQ